MPLATLRSESLLMTSGSRLRKSARRPNVTEPPCFGGPDAFPWFDPPPPPQAASTIRAAAIRIPSDLLPMACLPSLVAPASLQGAAVATAYTGSGRCALFQFRVGRA